MTNDDRTTSNPTDGDTTQLVTVVTTQPDSASGPSRETDGPGVLERLGDTDLSPADPNLDIRGRTVTDRHGDDIGHVTGLLIDRGERRVRFLEVGAGGFLGLGERHFLVPVEAVTAVGDDRVRIDRTREHVTGSPAYDPQLTRRTREDYASSYGYYGLMPYWEAGYVYPAVPLL